MFIRARSLNLSLFMLARYHVFNLRIQLKLLSHSQLLTGKVPQILIRVERFGNFSSSYDFKVADIVFGRDSSE